MRQKHFPLALIFVAIFGLGCKKSDSSAANRTAVTLPAGWTKAASKDGTLTIGVPPGWKKVENAGPFSSLGVSGGPFQKDLSIMHDPVGGHVIRPNVEVKIVKGVARMDQKGLVETYVGGLRSAAYLSISPVEDEDLPIGKARVVTYVNPMTEGRNVVNLRGVEHYAFDGDRLYIIKSEIPEGSGLDADAAAIVKTLSRN